MEACRAFFNPNSSPFFREPQGHYDLLPFSRSDRKKLSALRHSGSKFAITRKSELESS